MILGKSLFLFPEPVCKRRGIALIYDAAHVLGLMAGHQFQDPLAEGAPLVTGSTHKTFFGSPRGAMANNVDNDEWRWNHHFEPLDHVTNPAGLRMGVQEMTRVGMKEVRYSFDG